MNQPEPQHYPSFEFDLAELFLQQVEQHSARPAIITPEYTLSYAQLAEKALGLATELYQKGIQPEEPVAILMGPGVEHIICQLAVLLIGSTCVPLHPSLPDERIDFMLQEVNAKWTMTNASLATRSVATRFICLDAYPVLNKVSLDLPLKGKGLSQRSHILFTSGTTGQPKGVEIEARGIVRMLVDSNYIHIKPTDRVACHANPAFDGSFLEVWGALLNGASLVIIDKETLLDANQLENTLQQYAVSYLFMTTSLFNFIAPQCPNAFRSLNYLLVGGEAFNLQALKSLAPTAWPKKLLNCYGPTEGTTITLCHPIVAADLHAGTVPIGQPLNKTAVYILDDQMQPVTPGCQGEIYIGGEGVARGYVNRPELTREKFLTVKIAGEEHAKRLYRSGDLGWQRADGAIIYAGRVDNQIKLQGYRIEVEEIETQLLNSGQLSAAVVCVIRKEGDEAYLTAFIVPKKAHDFDSNALFDSLRQSLPPYMLPRLQVMKALPINENGKADRALLLSQIVQAQAAAGSRLHLSQGGSELLSIWQRVLDVTQATLDDEFFLLGGTSLQAARLVLEIKRQFGLRLTIQDLYDAQTPRNLLSLLQQPPNDVVSDICPILLRDSQLPDDIQPLSSPPQPWLTLSAGRVLLTGATGFMGAFCLRDLLKLEVIRQIVCLVRAENNDMAMQRIEENMNRYGLWRREYGRRIVALAGDLAKPQLGLDNTTYRHLTTDCDVIFHTAAHISFIEPYQTHRETNVMGSLNLLRLAVECKAKPLHYVSTIATMGPAGLLFPVERFYEEDDLMPYWQGLKYTLGYLQSKWVVERLMWQARERGIPLAVYRPGFMMTDSVTGVGNPQDFMWRMIKGCISTGASPLLPGDRKELIPVDYASAAMIAIASDNSHLGRVYHLIPPSDEHSISLNAFFELFAQCGYPLTPMPYNEWLQRLYNDPDLDHNPLMPLLPMLSEVVYEDLTVWEVFRNIPRYDASQAQATLAEAGGPDYMPTNAALLTRYLNYMKSIGLLSR
ncbi:amino acid adenylation domain-containing protein [Serratia fonticola]|uniref:non-ribosomal peptide synthetase n=1 Tax=Serratia fonticola TaxID=47917 RepID=UPI00157609FF|nr:non-ribosomal peptide synthetase [Serratia fonticola]NTY86598.1 amino acid adenylation domain-containing protein [Serratia fonticola]NTZ12680.1 amino acid adenylation domain-containing protein [Serratia fonticola]